MDKKSEADVSSLVFVVEKCLVFPKSSIDGPDQGPRDIQHNSNFDK